MPKPATVRVLALDGTWEAIGIDRAAGIWVENLLPEYDEGGPAKFAFDIRRQATRPWPDIGAFTPVDVEIAGQDAWTGRVSDTPSRDGSDRVMNVQCEGAQFVLDDDLYIRPYIHNKLSEWKDTRTVLGSSLTRFTTVGKVQTDSTITIGWAAGDTVPTNGVVGVTLDLGAAYARSVVVDFERINGAAAENLFCVGHNQPDLFLGTDGFFSTPGLSGEPTSGSYTGTSSLPVRYITLYVIHAAGGGVFGNDVSMRFTGIKVYADDSYRTSGLLASTVLLDGLDRATQGLSSDRSLVQATTTPLSAYDTGGPATPRKAWADVDAFHDWVKQIDQFRRPVYKPKPSAPIFEISSCAPGDFNDTSANSGDEIYNRTLLTATTTAGDPLVIERYSGAEIDRSNFLPLANPSADVDLSAWTFAASTVFRDTSVFDSGPASFRLATTASVASVQFASDVVTQQLVAGRRYRLNVRLRRASSMASLVIGVVNAGKSYVSLPPFPELPLNTWMTVTIDWVQPADAANYSVQVSLTNAPLSTTVLYLDSFDIGPVFPTLADRRGLRRTKELPINTPLPADLIAGNILADTWLTSHKVTPFKGTRTLVGDDAIRDIRTGQSVGLHTLGLRTMELARFADHIDPDTGGLGRDGRMTKVAYNHVEDTAEITIDNSRASFEALLARFGVAVGS